MDKRVTALHVGVFFSLSNFIEKKLKHHVWPKTTLFLRKRIFYVEKCSFSATHDALTFFLKKFEREKKHLRVVQ